MTSLIVILHDAVLHVSVPNNVLTDTAFTSTDSKVVDDWIFKSQFTCQTLVHRGMSEGILISDESIEEIEEIVEFGYVDCIGSSLLVSKDIRI